MTSSASFSFEMPVRSWRFERIGRGLAERKAVNFLDGLGELRSIE